MCECKFSFQMKRLMCKFFGNKLNGNPSTFQDCTKFPSRFLEGNLQIDFYCSIQTLYMYVYLDKVW